VLGVKFRAGGFYPFWQKNISQLTGLTVSAAEIFGSEAADWMNRVLDAEDALSMARQAEAALLARLPDRDALAELADRIVQFAMQDRNVIKVEQLCEETGMSVRQLQRLFRKYVGVGPKWVIKRFRLQEAAERIEREPAVLSRTWPCSWDISIRRIYQGFQIGPRHAAGGLPVMDITRRRRRKVPVRKLLVKI